MISQPKQEKHVRLLCYNETRTFIVMPLLCNETRTFIVITWVIMKRVRNKRNNPTFYAIHL